MYCLLLLLQGAVNCLAGLTFVFTGVGESLDKDQSTELAKQYGGRVTIGISSKTTYLVTGEGAGESKLAKVSNNRDINGYIYSGTPL